MANIDFINTLISGDTAKIQTEFDAIMAEKVQARLDTFRQETAQTLFKEAVELEESEDDLVIEDYSVEELEAFMQTEDYEQLDELSKNTLGSYISKAASDSRDSGANASGQLNKGFRGEAGKTWAKSEKRLSGIKKAVNKLTKESTDTE